MNRKRSGGSIFIVVLFTKLSSFGWEVEGVTGPDEDVG